MNKETARQAFSGNLQEQQMWRALQDIVSSGSEIDDHIVRQLDSRMQGYLFLQENVNNREARIAFARCPRNMPYLRDAAGSRNVWMSDTEFSELVEEDSSETLACFARSEQMAPHQLMYIEHKLSRNPHRKTELATADDALITARKVLSQRGGGRGLALMRLAKAALEGSAEVGTQLAQRLRRSVVVPPGDPRALWRAYLNLKALDGETLRSLLEAADMSSQRPEMTSGPGARSVH